MIKTAKEWFYSKHVVGGDDERDGTYEWLKLMDEYAKYTSQFKDTHTDPELKSVPSDDEIREKAVCLRSSTSITFTDELIEMGKWIREKMSSPKSIQPLSKDKPLITESYLIDMLYKHFDELGAHPQRFVAAARDLCSIYKQNK